MQIWLTVALMVSIPQVTPRPAVEGQIKQKNNPAKSTGCSQQPVKVQQPTPVNSSPKPSEATEQSKATKSENQGQDRLYTAYLISGAISALFTILIFMVMRRQLIAFKRNERAWIVPAIEQGFAQVNLMGHILWSTRCSIKNSGKSPARVTAFTTKRHLIAEGESLPPEPKYQESSPLNEGIPLPDEFFLAPGEPPQSAITMLTDSQLKEVRGRKLTLYIYGFATYVDIFGDDHETRFCYRYFIPRDIREPAFYPGGPHSYQRQT